jgi:Xaa-Pro aminopeptidase
MNLALERLAARLKQEKLDCLIVSLPANITYLTGCLSRDSYLLFSGNKNTYFTDFRYIEEAKKNLQHLAQVRRINGSVFKLIAAGLKGMGVKRAGFEERHLSFAEHKKLRQETPKGISLLPICGLIEDLRQIKSEAELEKIRQAAEITCAALRFIRKFISPGKREIEVAAELERFIRYHGAAGNSFDTIVAAGENSSFPHHITSQRKIKENEPVLIDIGVNYCGYKSDLTRVFFLGKITSAFKRSYDSVLKAQQRALKAIRPGVPIKRVDRAARQYIARSGFGRFFGHGLGHGIGLEVHEGPSISPKNKHNLCEGMVFTVEPAVYLPGRFGVRLEDMVLVTKEGVEVLSDNLDKSA